MIGLNESANGLNGFEAISSDLSEIVDLLFQPQMQLEGKKYDRSHFYM